MAARHLTRLTRRLRNTRDIRHLALSYHFRALTPAPLSRATVPRRTDLRHPMAIHRVAQKVIRNLLLGNPNLHIACEVMVLDMDLP
jgi:hypothetical protein